MTLDLRPLVRAGARSFDTQEYTRFFTRSPARQSRSLVQPVNRIYKQSHSPVFGVNGSSIVQYLPAMCQPRFKVRKYQSFNSYPRVNYSKKARVSLPAERIKFCIQIRITTIDLNFIFFREFG